MGSSAFVFVAQFVCVDTLLRTSNFIISSNSIIPQVSNASDAKWYSYNQNQTPITPEYNH